MDIFYTPVLSMLTVFSSFVQWYNSHSPSSVGERCLDLTCWAQLWWAWAVGVVLAHPRPSIYLLFLVGVVEESVFKVLLNSDCNNLQPQQQCRSIPFSPGPC